MAQQRLWQNRFSFDIHATHSKIMSLSLPHYVNTPIESNVNRHRRRIV